MTRRSFLIAFHWSTALLLLAMLKGGSMAPGLRWAFVLAGLGWLILMLVRGGPFAKPGPKLTGAIRAGFTPAHWAMYALLAGAVALNAATLFGAAPLEWAWNALLILFVASLFHAILHLWRHTALNDGALRMITPKIWHKHL